MPTRSCLIFPLLADISRALVAFPSALSNVLSFVYLPGVHLDHHSSQTGARGISPVSHSQIPPPQTPTMNGATGPNSGHHHSSKNSGSNSTSHRAHRSMHGSRNPDHKPTRVRTVLNEKQLQTLRNCYNANPRPDALMKEQLVEMTGLSPRVIRVW